MKSEVRQWLIDKLHHIETDGEYEYVDNQRFACTDSKEEMMDYNIQKDEGCCGSYDNEFVCPIDGKTYWVGFNYGH